MLSTAVPGYKTMLPTLYNWLKKIINAINLPMGWSKIENTCGVANAVKTQLLN